MKKYWYKLLSLTLLCSFLHADEIGKVIAVEGTANAGARSLARGASIFAKEVIKVADASKAQIRFSDGGVVNLIANTEFLVSSYVFNQGSGDSYSAELLKGGFRAISGSISKDNPSGFQVKTPVATIGIRGTIGEANIVKGTTYFGCEEGECYVFNGAREQILEAGQFVSSSSTTQLSEVTTVRPDALSEDLFTPPVDVGSASESISSSGEESESSEHQQD